jgi:hypothetical protein
VLFLFSEYVEDYQCNQFMNNLVSPSIIGLSFIILVL